MDTRVEGIFQYVIYSPKGDVEGGLIESEEGSVQLVLRKDDELTAIAFLGLRPGQTITVKATRKGPSVKGKSVHSVFETEELVKVDGRKPPKHASLKQSGYSGTVLRVNYARHGEPNGVILDSGDFIHLKPGGMSKLRLKTGDKVRAEGDAHRLIDDLGWAVDATHVNGKRLNPI
jgi:hypothetical protein